MFEKLDLMPESIIENIWIALIDFAPKLGTSLGIMIAFWVLSFVVRRIISKISRTNKVDPDLVSFMRAGGKWGILLIGMAMALGTLGIDITALVAGLGLTGFAMGYALRDTISNSIAGMMVIAYKPFRRNDLIKVGAREHKGYVRGIDLRYTVMENEEGDIIYIPNSLLFSNVVTVVEGEQEKEDLKLNQLSLTKRPDLSIGD